MRFNEINAEVAELRDGLIPSDEVNGRVLEVVNAIWSLDGDEATDEECLWMIHDVVNQWSEIADAGKN
jgi:hypothetical protein